MVMIISEEQVKEVMEEVKKAGEMINNVGKGGTSRCMGLKVGHICVLMNLAVREFRFWAYHIRIIPYALVPRFF